MGSELKNLISLEPKKLDNFKLKGNNMVDLEDIAFEVQVETVSS